jgi:hypothetical protein
MAVSYRTIRAFFRFLGWLFPAPRLDEVTSQPFETLRAKYESREWANLLAVLGFVALAAVFYFFISWWARLTTQGFVGVKFLLRPIELEYQLMGMFLSLVSVACFCLLAERCFVGKKEFDIHVAYYGHHVEGHFHAGKAFMWIFLLLFPPICVASLLRATTFTAVTDEAIFDAPFGSFGVPKKYPYADVRNIYFAMKLHARSEDIVLSRYVIVFKDGTQWKSDKRGGGVSEEESAMMQYVAQQSHKCIADVQFIEDIPP